MKPIHAALAAVLLCAPMAGCGTLQVGAPVLSGQSAMTASRTLYAAEAAFKGSSIALEAAVDTGQLKGSAATKARKAYAMGHEALLAARAARQAGNAVGLAAQAAAALSLFAQVQQLADTGGGFGVGTIGGVK